MQILVVGLRCAVTARIAGSQSDFFYRAVSYVYARREYYILHHVVFVYTTSDQEIELFTSPFILEKESRAVSCLLEIALKTEVLVM